MVKALQWNRFDNQNQSTFLPFNCLSESKFPNHYKRFYIFSIVSQLPVITGNHVVARIQAHKFTLTFSHVQCSMYNVQDISSSR